MQLKTPLLLSALVALAGCAGSGSNGGLKDPTPTTRGSLISYTKIKDISDWSLQVPLDYEDIDLEANYDVTYYKITYQTIDPSGKPYTASGAVGIPDNPPGNLTLLSYQHSTATQKSNVPSQYNDESWLMLAAFAGGGSYVVSMPDYLGLGDGPGLHPFLNASTEASASVDAMRAARALCKELKVNLTNNVLLYGYSQGGHSTMALTKEIQTNLASEFNVIGSACGAGPYDVSDTELKYALSNPSKDAPLFLSYVSLAYNEVYGLFTDKSTVWQSPYDQQVTALFDGSRDLDTIAGALPANPYDLFQLTFINTILNDTSSPFQQALQANNLYNWKPTIPIHLLHASSDEVVSYQNSVLANKTMADNGSTSVTLIDLGTGLTHVDAIAPATYKARTWFDTLIGASTSAPKRERSGKVTSDGRVYRGVGG